MVGEEPHAGTRPEEVSSAPPQESQEACTGASGSSDQTSCVPPGSSATGESESVTVNATAEAAAGVQSPSPDSSNATKAEGVEEIAGAAADGAAKDQDSSTHREEIPDTSERGGPSEVPPALSITPETQEPQSTLGYQIEEENGADKQLLLEAADDEGDILEATTRPTLGATTPACDTQGGTPPSSTGTSAVGSILCANKCVRRLWLFC